jgi:hypothetical protein
MRAINVLILLILLLAACASPPADVTPTAPQATATQEHFESAFTFYSIGGTVNIRDGIGTGFPMLGQLQAGETIVAFKTGVSMDGWPWLWLLNTCAGDGVVSGFVAMTVNVTEITACP